MNMTFDTTFNGLGIDTGTVLFTSPAAPAPAAKPAPLPAPKKAAARRAPTRAKVINETQYAALIDNVRRENCPVRNEALVRLGFEAGLRAVEISGLEWDRHILNSRGEVSNVIKITRDITKKSKEREVPVSKNLRRTLEALRKERPGDIYVVHALYNRSADTQRARYLGRGQTDRNTIAQYLRRKYAAYGLNGCTSHSGRRTFTTNLARKADQDANLSLRDVQELVGHVNIRTTQGYVDVSPARVNLVDKVFG